MGLARQEHDARIQPWERFATQLAERLSSSLQLHEVTLYKLVYTKVQADAKARLVSKYHPRYLPYGVTQWKYYD